MRRQRHAHVSSKPPQRPSSAEGRWALQTERSATVYLHDGTPSSRLFGSLHGKVSSPDFSHTISQAIRTDSLLKGSLSRGHRPSRPFVICKSPMRSSPPFGDIRPHSSLDYRASLPWTSHAPAGIPSKSRNARANALGSLNPSNSATAFCVQPSSRQRFATSMRSRTSSACGDGRPSSANNRRKCAPLQYLNKRPPSIISSL